MEKIFLISGRKQHGKDAVAKLIKYLVIKNRIRLLSKESQVNLATIESISNKNIKLMDEIIQNDCNTYNQRSINKPIYILGQETTTRLIDKTLDLIGHSDWLQVQFSTPLKKIVCSLTGCSLQELEDGDFKASKSLIKNNAGEYLTYRELLQYIGTDLFRDQINSDIWVESYYSSRREQIFADSHNKTIISDWRFPNEEIYLKNQLKIEVITIKVVNPHIFTPPNEHFSEKALDHYSNENYDFVISNYGDLNALIYQIKAMLVKLKIIA